MPQKPTAVRKYFCFRHSMDIINEEIKAIEKIIESFSLNQLREMPVDIGIIRRGVERLEAKVEELTLGEIGY